MASLYERIISRVNDFNSNRSRNQEWGLDQAAIEDMLVNFGAQLLKSALDHAKSHPDKDKQQIVSRLVSSNQSPAFSMYSELVRRTTDLYRQNQELRDIFKAESKAVKSEFRWKTFHRVLSAIFIAAVVLGTSALADYWGIHIGIFRVI